MFERDAAVTFEDDEFDPRFRDRYSAIAVKLVPTAVATAVLILPPPELFGRVQQYAAIREIETSFAETEDAVRADPRQRSIREAKLRARITAGSHGYAWANVAVY